VTEWIAAEWETLSRIRVAVRRVQNLEGQVTKILADIEWSRRESVFTDNRYSRAHTWRFDGGVEVAASSSPEIVPLPMSDAAAVDPEEAFVASLASCHMLWFLSIAAEAGFVVDRYSDRAEGNMGKNADGQLVVTHVTLRPSATWAGNAPAAAHLTSMHELAHEKCFIANSVKTVVRIEPNTT
jgi:organic hydroperoxide reductase OsmC/OhrA